MAEHPNAPRCHHVHTSGLRCGSPAMRNQKLCYYHKQTTGARPMPKASLPNFEDGPSLQLAFAHLARSVVQGGIDYRAADILTNIYRLALRNLKNMNQYVANHDDQVTFDPDLEDIDFQNSVAASPESHITEPITHEQEEEMIEEGKLPQRKPMQSVPQAPFASPKDDTYLAQHVSAGKGMDNDSLPPAEQGERSAAAANHRVHEKLETRNEKPVLNEKPFSNSKPETRNSKPFEELSEKEREAEIMRMCGNKAYFMKEEDMPKAPPPPDWEDIKAEISKALAG